MCVSPITPVLSFAIVSYKNIVSTNYNTYKITWHLLLISGIWICSGLRHMASCMNFGYSGKDMLLLATNKLASNCYGPDLMRSLAHLIFETKSALSVLMDCLVLKAIFGNDTANYCLQHSPKQLLHAWVIVWPSLLVRVYLVYQLLNTLY